MMNKNILYTCGMLLAGLLLTACSNGNWEDNLRDTIDQGGNNGKGADPRKVYDAIRGGLAGSTVLDAKIPKILAGDFAPGGTIKVNRKDINNVLSTAHACECPMPLSSQLFEILQYLSAHGHLMDDHGGIVQYFEDLAGVQVREH